MADYKLYNPAPAPVNMLYPVLALWGLCVVVLISFLAYTITPTESFRKFYLVPWCFLTAAVILAPTVYLIYKRSFDPFHPLVFPVWTYLFPAFVVGGLLLATNVVEPYYLSFVEDETYYLPLTLVYVMLGYAGLTVGFALPLGRGLGRRIAARTPDWNWQPRDVVAPGLILLALGLANTIMAFALGLLGFQQIDERGLFDGIVFLLSLFWIEASFFLWLWVFRSRYINVTHYLIIGLLLATSLTRSAFQGNRGIFISIFIMIAFAFVLSGRKITLKRSAWAVVIAAISLIFGMIYGTTFRSIKTTQEQMNMGEYAGVVSKTIEKVGEQNLESNLSYGFLALGERLEAVSALAVIVSNYEQLAPYEELYGINDNIWNETVTFFIPRVVWPEKPVAIEPSKYADLYFNYSENAFTMTPMGDLLRNFGPFGVPLGMCILGIILRIIYSALKENLPFSFWRAALYYMLITAISYEGTFGMLVPLLVKIGFTAIIGILIIRLFAGNGSPQPAALTR
jgi:hypothetical protein